MAETSSKVRLVRCPKCENLLPEMPDYSVYQCGGCGAVLRAKKGYREDDILVQNSEEERAELVAHESDSFLAKSEGFIVKETGSSAENGEGKGKASYSDKGNEILAKRYGSDSKSTAERALEGENDGKIEVGNGDLYSKVGDQETRDENANGLRRSGWSLNQKAWERGEDDRFGRVRRGDVQNVRFSGAIHAGEGTSRYALDSNYRNEMGRFDRAQYFDPERKELLKKLDELKDQLSRSCNVNDKPSERVPLDQKTVRSEPYADSDNWVRDPLTGFHTGSRQFYAPNGHVPGPHYLDDYPEPFPYMNRLEMPLHSGLPPMPSSGHVPHLDNSLRPDTLRRPPPRIPNRYQYTGPEPDPFESHPYNAMLDPISFPYYQIPPSSFYDRRFPPHMNKPMPPRQDVHGAFSMQGYNVRFPNPSMGSRDAHLHARWPSDINNLEVGSFSRSRPQRVVLANSGRHCFPVSGGAPFITCHNCFELLQFPKTLFQTKKSEWKMCCGACSSVISFSIVDKKLVSVDTPAKRSQAETLDSPSEAVHGHIKHDNTSLCSEDYANSVYDFQAMDREPLSSSACHRKNSSKSEEGHNPNSLSPSTSENEDYSDDLPTKDDSSPPPPGSPLQDHFDYSSKYRAVNRCGKGNLSSRSDQERVMSNKSTLRQNSLKESLATEMDLSHNDYAHTAVSQDSADVNKDKDQPKSKKGVDSFFTGIIKKSFRDFSRSNTVDSAKRNVSVNGHVIPDRLVKKAEKMAGPIYPGQYWYDYRAGFWGVMGGPCLGIIPPYIEEFNHPMPENCAGGNTNVFVNGRELHQKDLDLLTTRGLPAGKDRSYIVEISGRVLDEDTGEELDSLGKLAPTVEKVKHGFGMRDPKAAS